MKLFHQYLVFMLVSFTIFFFILVLLKYVQDSIERCSTEDSIYEGNTKDRMFVWTEILITVTPFCMDGPDPLMLW